jgi:polar amino acid transport system substrate-binding protein
LVDGKIVDIDVAREIAERLGVGLEVRDMKFSALIEAVKRDDVDIVIADMAITPERKKQVLFSIPYQVDYSVVIVRGGANIRYRRPQGQDRGRAGGHRAGVLG